MTPATDHLYMARALRLAERGLYTTDPNPRVGCVLVKAGEIVGEGWHERAGGPHAEIHALQQAGAQAAGATAYVTLEPCCHHGRTPPCTEALIAAGVTQVVVAMDDPNPLVAGKGLAALQQAGIETRTGVLAAESEQLNAGFVMRMRQGRPWVRCKLAMSIDGRTAMSSGESRWITGAAARRDVHRLRARSSAIMTGIETVLTDDPSLTARPEEGALGAIRQPLRVILDSRLRTPSNARLLGMPGKTVLLTTVTEAAKKARLLRDGVEVVTLPLQGEHLDLPAVLHYLGTVGMNEIHLEAGATLCGALLQADLIDELVLYMAPHLMGDGGRGLFALPGLATMKQRVQLSVSDLRAVGADWRISATVVRG
ncbi:MAG: bifunctional diaminohydroxyphosphoribosylaminopyrimidine deaminase/5-amino-6-(5-phosphoribosylamino)uracil reductase RibD [Gammaproteobacteria bacterium]|nr:bifunctional diaminohydroxyphosphoribosylaminopyrimidine deaminase/5-amino-6-(5-phosphoribosylamino)uracil reductase RibD [Gammaproteobacteria bacterium]